LYCGLPSGDISTGVVPGSIFLEATPITTVAPIASPDKKYATARVLNFISKITTKKVMQYSHYPLIFSVLTGCSHFESGRLLLLN
jgi:hypothetical protein